MTSLSEKIIQRFHELGKPLFYSDIYEPLRAEGYSYNELFRTWQQLIADEVITADEDFRFRLLPAEDFEE